MIIMEYTPASRIMDIIFKSSSTLRKSKRDLRKDTFMNTKINPTIVQRNIEISLLSKVLWILSRNSFNFRELHKVLENVNLKQFYFFTLISYGQHLTTNL